MLDDLKYIHERDAQDALGIAQKEWQQLQHEFGVKSEVSGEIKNVVLTGMGGSALPGVFLNSWPGLNVPFEIVRNYNLPQYVGKETLVISSSYSGNTEETLSALDEAEARGAQITVVAAGGKLLERAQAQGYPTFTLPAGIQPRMSTFYFIKAFVELLEPLGVIAKGSAAELSQTADWLKQQAVSWGPETPTSSNQAKQTALELMGKTVIVYSGPLLFPAANKWKICMNENAKNLAWCNQYPEFNHNEFIGWSSHPTEKPFAVIEIQSDMEHPRIRKRFEVSERLLSGKRPHPNIVKPQGETVLKQLLWSVMLGDHVSVYLALLNGLNPTPVDLVEKLKISLDK